MNKPGIILLADKAGCLNDFSAEFMPLPEFNAALKPVMESSLECFVVLSGSDTLWEQRLDELGIRWSVCPDAHLGLDACAAFGVHCTQGWHSWIIDVATTPATTVEHYKALSRSVHASSICGAFDDHGQRRFPMAFGRRYGFSLANHQNGTLKQALASHPPQHRVNHFAPDNHLPVSRMTSQASDLRL